MTVTHRDHLVLGYAFVCPACGERHEVAAGSQEIAVLVELGALPADRPSGLPDLCAISEHRVATSMRVLAADVTPFETTPDEVAPRESAS